MGEKKTHNLAELKRLYKLRPFMDPLLDNFRAAYNLGREIAIDKSMTGFKRGCTSFSTCQRSPLSGG